MRLCANENVPADCVVALRASGHDVLWVREFGPGTSDSAVLARAHGEQRVLLTFDKDFGDLVFRQGAAASNGIVLFRFRKTSPEKVVRRVTDVIASLSAPVGNYTVVDEHSVRVRPLR